MHKTREECGFTLIELLTAMAIISIVMALGVPALRHYWFVRSLAQGQGEVVAELRSLQQLAASESNPIVYGVRFSPNTSNWATFRYDQRVLTDSTDDVCAVESSQRLSTGAVFSSSTFPTASNATPLQGSVITRTANGCGAAGSDHVVYFFPKGSSNGGQVTISQPQIGRTLSVCVLPLTSRVRAGTC